MLVTLSEPWSTERDTSALKEEDTVDRDTVRRVRRGWILANLGEVEKDGPLYNVGSTTGRGLYVVDSRRDTCECKNWIEREDTCKHLVTATLVAARG